MYNTKVFNGLVEAGKREVVVSKTVCRIIGVGAFVILIALGAWVRIPLPFTPVPITLQTFFVLLAGATMGPMLGMASCTSYVILGCMGLPIFFGGGGGLTHLLGPTGGYLIGFVVASWMVGRLIRAKEKANFLWVVMAMVFGSLVIYGLGSSWLAMMVGLDIKRAFLMGTVPFLPGDGIKVLLAASLYERAQKRLRNIF